MTNTAVLATISPHIQSIELFRKVEFVDIERVSDEAAAAWKIPESRSGDVAFLQYTSGSTANPKGVMVTHGNLLANLECIHSAFEESPQSQGVIWLPPYHDMGLIGGILQPLYGNFPVTLMSPFAFLQKPLKWLEAISEYGATTSGGPNFAYDLCLQKISPEQRDALDLSTWKVAFNGAEPIHPETLDRFAEFFSPAGFRKTAFFPCYGLAESTLYVSGGTLGELPICERVDAGALETHRWSAPNTQEKTLVSSGRVPPSVTAKVVHPDTLRECPPDEIGELWLSGPSVARGYWNNPELTTSQFGAMLGDLGPFLRTGDLGIVRDGELFITGRLKDLIILRGRNFYPQDLEATAETAHPSLVAHGCAAFSLDVGGEERLVLAAEVRRSDTAELARAVFEAVSRELGIRHEVELHGVVLLRQMSLPKTSSGKIQRNLCRKLYEDGQLEPLGSYFPEAGVAGGLAHREPSQEPAPILESRLATLPPGGDSRGIFRDVLTEIVRQSLRVDAASLPWDAPLDHWGLDSIRVVNFVHHIERETGVAVPLEKILGGMNLQTLVEWIHANYRVAEKTVDAPLTEGALSHNQESLWVMSQYTQGAPVYHLNFAVKLSAGTDADRLCQAIAAVVAAHPALRTSFQFAGDGPRQRVQPRREHPVSVIDTANLTEPQSQDLLLRLAREPFDFEQGPLARFTLLRGAAGDLRLVLNVHHIVSDFWSLTVLARELGAAYGGTALAPDAGYLPFVAWQRRTLEESPHLWEYWSRQLGGELPVLGLNTDKPRPPVQTYAGASITLPLDRGLSGLIRKFGVQSGLTPSMVVLACFQALLHRYSGQSDLLIGTLTAGRQHPQFARSMGYFVNPVVLRSNSADDPSVQEFAAQTKKTMLEALEHQALPFPVLVERLRPPRDLSRSPLFQVLFVYQTAADEALGALSALALNAPGALRLGELSMEGIPQEQTTTPYDLTLTAAETSEGMTLVFQYNTDLFHSQTVAHMADHWKTLASHALAHPAEKLSQLPLLEADERRRLLQDWNATHHPVNPSALHQLFERQADRTPDAVAVRCDSSTATYGELERRANRLARALQDRGLQPGGPVALCVERSIDMVAALLAILKAGGYYIPLDPTHPKDRLGLILDDVASGDQGLLILTQKKLAGLFAPPSQPIFLDPDSAVWEASDGRLDLAMAPDALAYTIYTSGSTGKPKGVQIGHAAVVNFLHSMSRRPGITAADALLAVTTISFDIAGLEIYLPLMCGARVVLAKEHEVLHGPTVMKLLADNAVTIMQATPSVWRLLIEAGWTGNPRLRILCGGEAFPPELAAPLLSRCQEIWNMYGPTETTIWSTMYQVTQPVALVPIGKPIDNTRVYLLDAHLQPVPRGVSGELCLGGHGVARGYFLRPDLTAEKFVRDPFSDEPGARMYRTGDLARYDAQGNLEFLGRLDHQVKIRGFRIEIGEIEAALLAHAGVQNALVVAKAGPDGEKHLIAYLVARNGSSPSTSDLHRFLRAKLPDYMVPSFFVTLAAFPQTPNGKIDRKALPDPEYTRPELADAFTSPRGKTEELLVGAWKQALQIDKVGTNDNFFELGGTSLKMVQIHTQLSPLFPGRTLGIVDLFQYPTISALARYLDDESSGGDAKAQEAQIEARKDRSSDLEARRNERKRSRLEF